MLLACDIGNSRTKTGLFQNDGLKEIHSFGDTDTLLKYINSLGKIQIAVSSVVPSLTDTLIDGIKTGAEPLVITKSSRFNLEIDYDTPETLGIDRLCSAEGAYSLYLSSGDGARFDNNTVILSVDFGTATTINVIKYPGRFTGGLIAPGLGTMFASLHKDTAQLPLIDASEFTGLVGKSTKSSIASGVINSAAGLVQKVIEELKEEDVTKTAALFVTGGNAKFVLPYLSFNKTFDEGLVLRGIKAIYEKNV
jgi:type III pantothenate kinase